jgi:hypothetical protein
MSVVGYLPGVSETNNLSYPEVLTTSTSRPVEGLRQSRCRQTVGILLKDGISTARSQQSYSKPCTTRNSTGSSGQRTLLLYAVCSLLCRRRYKVYPGPDERRQKDVHTYASLCMHAIATRPRLATRTPPESFETAQTANNTPCIDA